MKRANRLTATLLSSAALLVASQSHAQHGSGALVLCGCPGGQPSALADRLKLAGASNVVTSSDVPVDFSAYRAVFLLARSVQPSERAALVKFRDDGGFLVVAGEIVGGTSATLSSLLLELGLSGWSLADATLYNVGCSSIDTDLNDASSPLMSGVQALQFASAVKLSAPGGSVIASKMGTPIVAADLDARVVVSADQSVFINLCTQFDEQKNLSFFSNIWAQSAQPSTTGASGGSTGSASTAASSTSGAGATTSGASGGGQDPGDGKPTNGASPGSDSGCHMTPGSPGSAALSLGLFAALFGLRRPRPHRRRGIRGVPRRQ
jgi:hypothetical protein